MSICGECARFDWANKQTSSVDRRRCVERGIYIEPTASSCRYFIKKEKGQESGCFITTVVVDILGYQDDCWILNTLRDFRNNVMQKSNRYSELLMIYDAIGPKIAGALKEKPNRKEISILVSQYYLIPICKSINNEDYTSAVNSYVGMVRFLQNQLLVLDSVENYLYDENVAEEEKGHGKARVKLVTE